MRTLRIYSFLTTFICISYSCVNYIYHVLHYIPSITGSSYLLTTFIQFCLLQPPALVTTNLISFSVSLFLICNWSIAPLVPLTQHSDLIFLCIWKWSHYSSSCRMSPYKGAFHAVHFKPVTQLFHNWKFVCLHLPHLSLLLPPLSPLATACFFSVSITLVFFFCLSVCFGCFFFFFFFRVFR